MTGGLFGGMLGDEDKKELKNQEIRNLGGQVASRVKIAAMLNDGSRKSEPHKESGVHWILRSLEDGYFASTTLSNNIGNQFLGLVKKVNADGKIDENDLATLQAMDEVVVTRLRNAQQAKLFKDNPALQGKIQQRLEFLKGISGEDALKDVFGNDKSKTQAFLSGLLENIEHFGRDLKADDVKRDIAEIEAGTANLSSMKKRYSALLEKTIPDLVKNDQAKLSVLSNTQAQQDAAHIIKIDGKDISFKGAVAARSKLQSELQTELGNLASLPIHLPSGEVEQQQR